jgi:hypothetical protein
MMTRSRDRVFAELVYLTARFLRDDIRDRLPVAKDQQSALQLLAQAGSAQRPPVRRYSLKVASDLTPQSAGAAHLETKASVSEKRTHAPASCVAALVPSCFRSLLFCFTGLRRCTEHQQTDWNLQRRSQARGQDNRQVGNLRLSRCCLSLIRAACRSLFLNCSASPPRLAIFMNWSRESKKVAFDQKGSVAEDFLQSVADIGAELKSKLKVCPLRSHPRPPRN